MLEFLSAAGNTPFVVALAIMAGILILQVGSLVVGLGLAELIESVMPDFDADADVDLEADIGLDLDADADLDLDADVHVDADVDADADADFSVDGADAGAGILLTALSWLGLGKVPVLILLALFLALFGVSGLATQSITISLSGGLMNGWLATVVALVVSLPLVSLLSRVVGRVLPKETTEAVSNDSLVGRIATISQGTARLGNPAQARLRDDFGQAHYVLVEPQDGEAELSRGTEIVLVSRDGTRFTATRFENSNE